VRLDDPGGSGALSPVPPLAACAFAGAALPPRHRRASICRWPRPRHRSSLHLSPRNSEVGRGVVSWLLTPWVVTAAGGHGSIGTKTGDYVIAYALMH
jgi:hypothetical protein